MATDDEPAPTQYLKPRRYKDEDEITEDAPGHQAPRVYKKLAQLEAEGTVLKHYTVMELRHMLEKRFAADKKSSGLEPPSRQVMDIVIKHRLRE